MGSSTKARTEQIRVVVSDDQLQAWIELPGKALPDFSPPSEKDVMAVLDEQGIEVTDAVGERVEKYVGIIGEPGESQGPDGPREIPERFLIAEGQPPVDARDGDFEWDEAFNQHVQEWQGDAPVNYYAANSILTFAADTLVGRIIPLTPSCEGRDVLGKEVTPKRKTGLPLELGDGLATAADDPLQVVTTVPGRLVRQRQTLRVDEVLEIPGDVDFNSGNIDSVIDVHVRGYVKPNFVVKTTKSLVVRGSVEAAELDVEGDIQVRGGLFGQESGCRIKAGGVVTASICDAADVEAGGDIRISKEIINSNVRTAGELLIEHGSVIGGEVFARNGAKLKHAGSEAGVPTQIVVGMDGAVLYRAQRIDEQVEKQADQVKRVQALVQPLMANMKRLTPAQRERATELVAKVSEIELAGDELRAERDRILEEATPEKKPGIEVKGTLYAGVTLVFELREVEIKAPIKGPMRVEERRIKGVTEIAVVNKLTGSEISLPSAAVNMKRFERVEQEPGASNGTGQERSDDGDA